MSSSCVDAVGADAMIEPERRDGVACDVVARSTVLLVLELDDEVCLRLSVPSRLNVGRRGN